MKESDLNLFLQCHLLASLSKDECREAITLLRPTVAEFPADSIIFSAREFVPSLIFVISGCITVERKEKGKRVLLNQLGAGDCFGAASMFGAQEDFPTRVSAKTDVRIAAVDEAGLKSLFNAYPLTAINHIRYLSEKIRFLNKKIAALTGRDTESKVSNYILSVYGKSALQTKINMAETARKLDMGRASLYRVITQLHDSGIIDYHNGFIKIKNIKELERLAK